FRDGDAGIFQRADLRGGSPLPSAHDRTGVSHAASGRRGGSGDETRDWLAAVLLDPLGGFFFRSAADFADHDDAVRLGIVVEHFDHVEMRRAVHGITADADAR